MPQVGLTEKVFNNADFLYCSPLIFGCAVYVWAALVRNKDKILDSCILFSQYSEKFFYPCLSDKYLLNICYVPDSVN